MEKYLKIGDYFGGDLSVSSGTRERIVSAQGEVVATTPSPQVARLAVHAINSHDELVAMNKELLAVIERVIGSSEKFDKVMGTSEWADGYKQCAIDTGEALRVIIDNIKAKAAS